MVTQVWFLTLGVSRPPPALGEAAAWGCLIAERVVVAVAVVAGAVADVGSAVAVLLCRACGNHTSLRASFCPSPPRWRVAEAWHARQSCWYQSSFDKTHIAACIGIAISRVRPNEPMELRR